AAEVAKSIANRRTLLCTLPLRQSPARLPAPYGDRTTGGQPSGSSNVRFLGGLAMAIRHRCPACSTSLRLGENLSGKSLCFPNCGAALTGFGAPIAPRAAEGPTPAPLPPAGRQGETGPAPSPCPAGLWRSR